MNESGRGLPLPAFKKQLIAVTEAAQPDDFFLEHSREREVAYTLENTRRWHEVVTIASRHPGDGPTKSCLDVGTSPLTFVLKDYFQRVATLDYTGAFAPRCRRHGIDFFQGGILAEPDLLPEAAYDCILFLEMLEPPPSRSDAGARLAAAQTQTGRLAAPLHAQHDVSRQPHQHALQRPNR